ncbi:hypothetical protein ACJIZ3_007836 [Penstemon smallii]|uniref:GATA transcription factor n=1 Tax=Penstemon smallii TaxID=265156 RepID=A0ABD3T8R9_9LAMI
MDVYSGLSVDDLLNLPNDDFFTSPSAAAGNSVSDFLHHQPSSATTTTTYFDHTPKPAYSTDFTQCVTSDDAAELEWLSNYMDDSFTDFPANTLTAANFYSQNRVAFHGRARSKRSRPSASATVQNPASVNGENEEVARRCSHCASEKTPQWRTGPMGPKTLCNACGVRYKSGRLVPEYRPAASPTFVLTQHSNSHRKVLELRRQKEMFRQQQPQQQLQDVHGRHFRVC